MQCEEVFLNDWKGKNWKGLEGKELIAYEFNIPPEKLADVDILYASYTYEDYSGSALVVFKHDGKLFMVSGGHCSCYGLENQWEPEETSVEVLERMLASSSNYYYTLGGSGYDSARADKTAFASMLEKLKAEGING